MSAALGACPTTGLLGLTLGGGVGRLQGKYGYLVDNLLAASIVIFDGSILQVSKDSHPDLFWAIRGAGHNFGIVVEATFRTYPQEHQGIHYNWDFEFTTDQSKKVFDTLATFQDIDPDLAITVMGLPLGASGSKVSQRINEPESQVTKLIVS